MTDESIDLESVLVLGCTGVLGQQLTRKLISDGRRVVGLVHTPRPNSQFVRDRMFEQIHVVRGDIRNTDQLAQMLAIHEIATIYQCAGVSGSGQETHQLTQCVFTAVASGRPTARVIVPIAPQQPLPNFRTHPFQGIRVAFVRTLSADLAQILATMTSADDQLAQTQPVPVNGLWVNAETTSSRAAA